VRFERNVDERNIQLLDEYGAAEDLNVSEARREEVAD
jgi:hypothetical protein